MIDDGNMEIKTKLVYSAMKSRVKTIDKQQGREMDIQIKQLKRILATVERTEYGEEYKLKANQTYQHYCRRAPIVDYEDLRPRIEQMIHGRHNVLLPGRCDWYAQSSGTTSTRSKFIPVPKIHLKECHFRGASDALWLYLRNRPDSRFFSTKGLVLGGAYRAVANGATAKTGDLSSILVEKMPLLGDLLRVPPKKILLMDEWEEKLKCIVRSTAKVNVGSLSGVPSWMLVMIKALLEQEKAANLSEVWPNLEVFFHGGVSFEPYRSLYRELIPSNRMQYVETYNASEGFFAIQDEPSEQSMRIMPDYGVFYEFIPFGESLNSYPRLLTLEEVQIGVPYSMVISTLGGLYRYKIGDVVTFKSRSPYRIKITGRTKHYINAFGEELMVDNADKAIAIVSAKLDMQVVEYTAAPQLLEQEGKGRHNWLIEFATPPNNEQAATFAKELDAELRNINSDYDAKRYKDMTLLPLSLTVAPRGTFHEWLAKQGKLGGQHKVPRLSNERKYLDSLLAMLT